MATRNMFFRAISNYIDIMFRGKNNRTVCAFITFKNEFYCSRNHIGRMSNLHQDIFFAQDPISISSNCVILICDLGNRDSNIISIIFNKYFGRIMETVPTRLRSRIEKSFPLTILMAISFG